MLFNVIKSKKMLSLFMLLQKLFFHVFKMS
jgi:hypothetical protein